MGEVRRNSEQYASQWLLGGEAATDGDSDGDSDYAVAPSALRASSDDGDDEEEEEEEEQEEDSVGGGATATATATVGHTDQTGLTGGRRGTGATSFPSALITGACSRLPGLRVGHTARGAHCLPRAALDSPVSFLCSQTPLPRRSVSGATCLRRSQTQMTTCQTPARGCRRAAARGKVRRSWSARQPRPSLPLAPHPAPAASPGGRGPTCRWSTTSWTSWRSSCRCVCATEHAVLARGPVPATTPASLTPACPLASWVRRATSSLTTRTTTSTRPS